MNLIEQAPTLLSYCILGLMMSGLVIFAFGKNLPGKGSWFLLVAILLCFTGIGFEAGFFLKEEFRIKVWLAGWVWPRTDQGAITVGIFQDPLSIAVTALACLMSSALLLNPRYLDQQTRVEKTYAALAISTAGVALSWLSLTPWLVLAGIVLTLFGGLISFGPRWDSHNEADVAARFARERAFGLILAFFGACILATSRSALIFDHPEVWVTNSENLNSTWVGATLLVAGLFIQMQPFPFLGSIVSGSKLYSPLKTLLSQIFPAWAAFSLLLRLEPQFHSLGLLPRFGWIALSSSILAVLSGLFQREWRESLGAWLAAGFSLSSALLAFDGPLSATGFLLGISLGAMSVSSAASILEVTGSASQQNKKRAIWLKASVFLGTAAGTGVVGFISAIGGVRWIAHAINLPGNVAIFLCAFFLFVLLGWKVAWNIVKLRGVADISWLSIFSVMIWILLSFAFVWTGSATGMAVMGIPDEMFASLFDLFFGKPTTLEMSDSTEFFSASGLYWGVLILAFFTAFWTAGRKEDRWEMLSSLFPKTTRFLTSGYSIDQGALKVVHGIIWLGGLIDSFIDFQIWANWFPRILSRGVTSISYGVNRIDLKISAALIAGIKKMIEIPAKTLQLIQTGDVRWYLLFALGSGFALLLYYLKM